MKKARLIAVAAAAALGIAAYLGASGRSATLFVSGTIEARNIRIGSKVGGRIREVKVREGDIVTAGQVLVTFEDEALQAALDEARANLEKMEKGYRSEEIAEARAAAAQARAEYEERLRGYRSEQVEAARAEVERAAAEASRAAINYRRVKELTAAGIFSTDQLDEAEGTHKSSQGALKSAEARLAELEHGYRPEQVASAEARWRQAEAVLEMREHGNRSEDVDLARAQLLDAETRWKERQVTAPAEAAVEVLDIRPGDLIAPNTPVATLLERDQLYLRVYVPETRIGDVRVGQKAELRVDSFPGEVFEAQVEQINQKAEFLPRNVQTREERVHQVFGVKLRVKDPGGRIRAGVAADVVLRLGED